jgi:hypothetical protein
LLPSTVAGLNGSEGWTPVLSPGTRLDGEVAPLAAIRRAVTIVARFDL